MKHFILTSPSFEGQIELKYNQDARLILYKNDSQMDTVQQDWMLKNMPVMEDKLAEFSSRIKGRLEEVPPDLSFETAYELFGYKRNAFRAKKIWSKLKEGDKMNCIRSFKAYQRYVDRKGIAQMCFDRYLSEEHWNTEWHTLK
jgi:hypothetical protein